ncbi:hypothetical protein BDZ91DRAFT_393160 [Kalaharituber pfeilii]|nr:hypothetical protein BDZ91DRAFT_393160 [Kalaharituber pfeilii]
MESVSTALARLTLEDAYLKESDQIALSESNSTSNLRISPDASSSKADTALCLQTHEVFKAPPPLSRTHSAPRNLKLRIRIIPSSLFSRNNTCASHQQPFMIEKSFSVNMDWLREPRENKLTHPFHLYQVHKRPHDNSLYSPPPLPCYKNAELPVFPHAHTQYNTPNIHNQSHLSHVPALPIHVEYATYRAPLLGAILLSGFVKRGDTLEIPMPWPDVWEETVAGIYIGGWNEHCGYAFAEKVRANLEYLGWQQV